MNRTLAYCLHVSACVALAACGSTDATTGDCDSNAQSNAAGCAPVVLSSFEEHPAGMALDATHVYWTNSREVADAAPSGGTIRSAPLAGGEPSTLVAAQYLPTQIGVDATNIYWLDEFVGQVIKRPLAGGKLERLASSSSARNLVIDQSHAYWSSYDASTNTDSILAVPLAGGPATTVTTTVPFITSIAVDETQIYWGEYNSTAATLRFQKAQKTGASASVLYANSESGLWISPIAVDAHNLYWFGPSGNDANPTALLKLPLAGGEPVQLASGYIGSALAIDARNAYWVSQNQDATQNEIMQVPLEGGASTAIANTNGPVSAIVTGNGTGTVCWAVQVPGSISCRR